MKLPADFYPNYWQLKPCWVEAAVTLPAPSIDDLWAWAEDNDQARLVFPNRGFEVELNPEKRPSECHTLLVSQIEQHWPELDDWARRVPQLGRWRFADLMISHATQGASVGAHRDQYDVFLIQLSGTRRWQVGTTRDAQLPETSDSGSRLLAGFEPDFTVESKPGDLLYIPPGCGHLGEALSDDCMTLSVGFRQPLWSEVFDQLHLRVADAGRTRPPETLDTSEAKLLRNNLHRALNALSDGELLAAYARAVTEPADWLEPTQTGPTVRFAPGARAANLGEQWVIMGEKVPALPAELFDALHGTGARWEGLSPAEQAIMEDWAQEGWIESTDG